MNLTPRLLGEKHYGAVVHVVSLETRVRFHEGENVYGTRFAPSTSVFPNNYYSVSASHVVVCHLEVDSRTSEAALPQTHNLTLYNY